MNKFPILLSNKYQILEQLNHNHQGGRITYKALEVNTNKLVVIKQFRFATTSNWDSYKEIEREINVLQGLKHSGIPQYLDKFDSGDGLCLVQEYKEAKMLSSSRSFSPEEVKSIAVQLLEILVDLQKRIPPVFHRDIKPENVLVDQNIKVYLIDFGLARIGSGPLAMSSLMGGTMGFMPPEQVHNQRLTEASDLYGLGATLICLITQTNSSEIGSLVDFSSNKITFVNKIPKLNRRFIAWLEKMVEPNPANRYPNANAALKALKPLDVFQIPQLNLDLSVDSAWDEQKLGKKKTDSPSDPTLEKLFSISPYASYSIDQTRGFDKARKLCSKKQTWLNKLMDEKGEDVITFVVTAFVVTIIVVTMYAANLAEVKAKKTLFLVNYKNQKLLINQKKLEELEALDADFSSQITLNCSSKSFVISFSDSYEFRKISRSEVPSQAINCIH